LCIPSIKNALFGGWNAFKNVGKCVPDAIGSKSLDEIIQALHREEIKIVGFDRL
jgi:hypothetical protein